jgi:hypothetical protein
LVRRAINPRGRIGDYGSCRKCLEYSAYPYTLSVNMNVLFYGHSEAPRRREHCGLQKVSSTILRNKVTRKKPRATSSTSMRRAEQQRRYCSPGHSQHTPIHIPIGITLTSQIFRILAYRFIGRRGTMIYHRSGNTDRQVKCPVLTSGHHPKQTAEPET